MNTQIENSIVDAIMKAQPSIVVNVQGRKVEVELPEPQRAGTEFQKRTYAMYAAQKLSHLISVRKDMDKVTYYDTFRNLY